MAMCSAAMQAQREICDYAIPSVDLLSMECLQAALPCCAVPHLLPGGPNAAEGSITCRPLGFLIAGGSSDRAASARCAALKYNVWSASQLAGY